MVQQAEKRRLYRELFGLQLVHVREFKEYVLEIQAKFQRDVGELKEQYDKNNKEALNEQDAGEIAEFYTEQVFVTQKLFLRTFRYSVIVSVYSLLESSMADLCRLMRRAKGIALELADIRGNGIRRHQIYLKKVCGVDFPDKTHEWQEIEKLAQLRHCIVHAQGDIRRAKHREKIENIVKSSKHLELDHHAIVLDSDYIDAAIQWVETFLSKLHDLAVQEVP